MPAYLSDLHLREIFLPYTTSVEHFILESTNDEHIVDSNSQRISGFVTTTFGQLEDTALKYFAVKNDTGKPYSLLQIDNGIIQDVNIKKCDCAIANEKYLCFIEFKANAYSNNTRNLNRNYNKAIDQLSTTIALFDTYFSSRGVDLLRLRTVEAYICFRQGFPRNTSSQMNYQVSFATSNRGIPLSFVRNKTL